MIGGNPMRDITGETHFKVLNLKPCTKEYQQQQVLSRRRKIKEEEEGTGKGVKVMCTNGEGISVCVVGVVHSLHIPTGASRTGFVPLHPPAGQLKASVRYLRNQ